jgi:nanoRNase/pAp phosphatase (c-di-AMP/oligoRNAs hydrolase)
MMVRKVKMPDQDNTKTQPVDSPTPVTDPGADNPTPIIPSGAISDDAATTDAPAGEEKKSDPVDNSETIAAVASKIGESHNILVALSSDPSIDELAAAIGLSLYLDRIGKRVTAIYSGSTPNVLKFLKPEETFETSADILQDFVIALNKEKADHLRYKLDGDYVKIFITPYRSRITADDLEFSYGDFNVDLVIALDVANGVDLDDALREHGRIMHDAVVVNVTTGKPGKLGEIEWSDKTASSVSEMLAELLYGLGKEGLQKEEATAFLTGIVASTNRFATASTTSRTMKLSARLIDSGANQQLVSKNITSDVDNQLFGLGGMGFEKSDRDQTKLDIKHGNEEDVDESVEIDASVNEKESTLLNDLKAAEASLSGAAAEVTPDDSNKPVDLDKGPAPAEAPATEAPATPSEIKTEAAPAPVEEPTATGTEYAANTSSVPEHEQSVEEQSAANNFEAAVKPEKVIGVPTDFTPETLGEGTNKYGQMLEDALAEAQAELSDPNTIIASPSDFPNPATAAAPAAATAPEINGVPDINYMPLPGDEVLPPPPTPPIDMNAAPTPAQLGPQPAMQDQIYGAQASNPGAFQIPGM